MRGVDVIKFGSDLGRVGGFLRFPPSTNWPSRYNWTIFENGDTISRKYNKGEQYFKKISACTPKNSTWDQMANLYRRHPLDASYQVADHLAKRF